MKERHKSIVEKALGLHEEGCHNEAIDLLRKFAHAFDSPQLHVLEGRLIQLAKSREGIELNEVEDAFKEALKIDDTYIEAYLELGWFYLNVQNDAVKAKEFFDEAEGLSRNQLLETLEGKLKCVAETETSVAAKRYLSQIQNSLFSAEQLKKLQAATDEDV